MRMDAAWLNRAGILAEASSFFLIAPEIIGVERLRRLEARIESFAPPLRTANRRWRSYVFDMQFRTSPRGIRWLIALWLAIPHMLVLLLLFILLELPLDAGIWLLDGQDRLRALVFGTGVVLLFGGMAAQFLATF